MSYLSNILQLEQHFYSLGEMLFSELRGDEKANLNLNGENSHFTRFNQGKIRQSTMVDQAHLALEYQWQGKRLDFEFSLQGHPDKDWETLQSALADLRELAKATPSDPFMVPIANHGTSRSHFEGRLPQLEESINDTLNLAKGSDFVGILTTGPVARGNMNSEGQKHWFSTETFVLDYSLFNEKRKAVKASFAGRQWDSDKLKAQLEQNLSQLAILDRPEKKVPRGKYRVYLAPAAMDEIIGTLSWGGLSYGAKKRGNSLFSNYDLGSKVFSPKFSLRENFASGQSPKFNALGEVSADSIPLIEKGVLTGLLTSSRSAKEYGTTGNAAIGFESMRSPELLSGQLNEGDVLAALGTGLYLSNLHYLNWSDRLGGRITGMTRYACFWVEGGEIVAPISDLRFDESVFDCFGKNLMDLTSTQEEFPSTSTYWQRQVGGTRIPGALIEDFTFTL